MPALLSRRAAPVRRDNSALVRVLETTIETLRAENDLLQRRLAAAEARAAARERCPWWCRRLGSPDDRTAGPHQDEGDRRTSPSHRPNDAARTPKTVEKACRRALLGSERAP